MVKSRNRVGMIIFVIFSAFSLVFRILIVRSINSSSKCFFTMRCSILVDRTIPKYLHGSFRNTLAIVVFSSSTIGSLNWTYSIATVLNLHSPRVVPISGLILYTAFISGRPLLFLVRTSLDTTFWVIWIIVKVVLDLYIEVWRKPTIVGYIW